MGNLRIILAELPTLKYGRWTILKEVERSGKKKYQRRVLAECECGTVKTAPFHSILSGKSKSCGCYKKDWSHGLSSTRLYFNCDMMMRRCRNPKDRNFEGYGGRGIRFNFESPAVAAKWITDNLGPKPSKDHTIDRVENNGHYEAGNLRWATRSQQQNNRRPYRTKLLQYSLAELLAEIASREPK